MASWICRVVAMVASLRCMSHELVDPGLNDVVEVDPVYVLGVLICPSVVPVLHPISSPELGVLLT